VSGQEAGGSFANGFNNTEVLERTLESIRKQAEISDKLHSFILHHGLGGGTGSGLASRLMESLSVEYGK